MTSTVASAIIQKAYQNAGKIPRGATPSPVQLTDALSTLYDVIALEVTQGLKLWLETEVDVPLVAGQQMYTFSPIGNIPQTRPLMVKEASYTDTGGSVRRIDQISREEWNRQPNRTSRGTVTMYFVEKLYDRLNMYLWLVPDALTAQGKLLVVLANQASLPVNLTDNVRFPPEWGLFLQWRLTQELATGMPAEVINRADRLAMLYRSQVEAFDIENAPVYFTVDTQGRSGSPFA